MSSVKYSSSISLAVCCLLLVAIPVFAAELFFNVPSKEFGIGKRFEIGVFLNTENEFINAVEGTIAFPKDVLTLQEVRDGNSVISPWIQRPSLTFGAKEGEISFAGIVPGGYKGRDGLLFTTVFFAKETGDFIIDAKGVRVLRNDEMGSETQLRITPIGLSVVQESSAADFFPLSDSIPPEQFTPEITQDPNAFDERWFLAFTTQDKGLGLDHYEVFEKEQFGSLRIWRSQGWQAAESPYVLRDQTLKSSILVKAIDKARNERIATIPARNSLAWYENLFVWVSMGIGILLLRFIWKRFKKLR